MFSFLYLPLYPHLEEPEHALFAQFELVFIKLDISQEIHLRLHSLSCVKTCILQLLRPVLLCSRNLPVQLGSDGMRLQRVG